MAGAKDCCTGLTARSLAPSTSCSSHRTTPAPGLGDGAVPTLKGLAKFVAACEAVYDGQLDAESVATLNVRQQRSALGGARPKRTLQDNGMLILAKPRDRFDH